jgi:hypothetical protein
MRRRLDWPYSVVRVGAVKARKSRAVHQNRAALFYEYRRYSLPTFTGRAGFLKNAGTFSAKPPADAGVFAGRGADPRTAGERFSGR